MSTKNHCVICTIGLLHKQCQLNGNLHFNRFCGNFTEESQRVAATKLQQTPLLRWIDTLPSSRCVFHGPSIKLRRFQTDVKTFNKFRRRYLSLCKDFKRSIYPRATMKKRVGAFV